MVKTLLFSFPVLLIILMSTTLLAQTGALKGRVLDVSSGEAISFANIVVIENGNTIAGGVSDFDGNYTIKPLPAGRFTVKATFVGYNTIQINNVLINSDRIRFLDLKMSVSTQNIDEVEVVAYTVPLIDKDNTTTGGTVTSKELQKMAGRSVEAVASTVGGVYQEDGKVMSVRGSRDGATTYYIDGVKVRGSNNLPKSSIAEVSVITGGVPARYGDATGGIINIVTKGASKEYFGGIEMVTSSFLDPYNSNIIAGNLSGPLLTRKIIDPDNPAFVRKESLLGFFIAGEYHYDKDPKPSSTGFWKAKDNILDSIKRTPYVRPGGAEVSVPTAAFLTEKDFEHQKYRENVSASSINISGKLDFQPVKNIVFTLGGNYQYNNGYYPDSDVKGYKSISAASSLFNYENNTQAKTTTYRVYGRLTHRFAEGNESGIIKNAYYTVQADFSKYKNHLQDKIHKDNLFDYGYLGKFTTYSRPTYVYGHDTISGLDGYIMNSYQDTLVTFDPATTNPDMARITEQWYEFFGNPMNKTDLQKGNGLLNGELPGSDYGVPYSSGDIYGMVKFPGIPTAGYIMQDNNQYRVSFMTAGDIGDHEISFGFEFEKRIDRNYTVSAVSLWQLARDKMNSHIQELDFSNPVVGYIKDENGNPIFDSDGNPIFNDTINYNRIYNAQAQSLFDIKFRESQGIEQNSTEIIDIDSYAPEDMKIDFFSADELYNNSASLVSYYGYDAYGNKLNSNPSFADYFTQTYNYGGKEWYKRDIAPFEPIYMAGYIQDKFSFNDLVFNVGVRVDRYDANQPVQKDPYLVFTAYKTGDDDSNGIGIINEARKNGDIPANISDNAVVYVDNRNEATKIVGYREGSNWYDTHGNQINDPALLYQNGSIQPYLTNPSDRIGDKSFLDAFEDYDPAISVMPRISFSFPISDEALFFAHYDILTRRPSSYLSRINPYDYLFIEQFGTRYFSNPNLKPEKTIDYEFGFQQKLTDKSSLKMSAFYREQRDMVQAIYLPGAYPISMRTYGNIDFGTIKGFTFTYDLRRTRNVSLKASYTLQFANASGSNATTSRSLINSGQPNLRTTLPTDFDQRHAFSILLDYRFGSGRSYNGPHWFNSDVFADAGVNFTVNTGSGTPYTKKDVVSNRVTGSVNGSYMPWRSTVNMKIDKSFIITMGEGEDSHKLNMNIYLDVFNLFNTINVLGVYPTSGNPDDDAVLTSSRGIADINSAYSAESYINYYNMMLANPAHYGMPRQIRLGILVDF